MTEVRGFKFVATLVLVLKEIESQDKAKYDTFYSHSKAEIFITESDIDDSVFKSIYATVISNIQNFLVKESDWITDSVIEHNINISKHNPLAGSSYTKLSKELHHSRKGLINIQTINDNERLKWCIVRYLHPADHHPARIRKTDEILADELNFEGIKFPVKIKDIHKIEKRNSIGINVFGYENEKNIQSIHKKDVMKTNMLIHY